MTATIAAPNTEATTTAHDGITVAEVTDRFEFARLQPEWDAPVRATGDDPNFRHSLISAWIDNFAPTASLCVLTGRDSSGALVAALPLLRVTERVFGMPARALISAANDHLPRTDIIAAEGSAAGQAFFEHLTRNNSWDMLRLKDVPDGGRGWNLFEAAERSSCPTGIWASVNSPYIELPASYDAMQKQLDSRFRANLRRRRKKLEEMGHVTVEKVTGGVRLPFHLEEGLALEQSGWKGRGGTAIAQDQPTWGFYSELARTASYEGSLALYFLRLDGRPVAFHYGITSGSTYYLLKPAYDESVRECSPGQLLMDEVVRRCIDEGLREFDFLGPDMVWKSDWTPLKRQHTWLYVFNDTAYGRLLREYKFHWTRQAKRLVKRWRKA
jgi:CelD/BcsL family acetyltransferase involved in cellulose biosynthesis